MSEIIINENINLNIEVFTHIKSSFNSILSHTLLLGPYNIKSLSISKSSEIERNRVIFTNPAEYDVDIYLSYDLLKKCYNEKYFVIIELPNHLVFSNLLKITNINITDPTKNIFTLKLEEVNFNVYNN